MIDKDSLLARDFPVVEHTYTSKDCALFALGVGLGKAPVSDAELRAVYERAKGFAALPIMANVLGYPGFWAMEPDTGLIWQKILHGEQNLTVHAAIAESGTILGKTRVTDVIDKGKGKGALIYTLREISDKATGVLLAEVHSTLFARADGGFGGENRKVTPPHEIPDRAADVSHDVQTSTRAALIYRLSGDLNPLHADPSVARAAGFDRPILHGLCTMAVSAWSLTSALRNGDFTALQEMRQRFSAPVYPGETVRTEIWVDGDDVSFRARAVERDVVVLNNGLARLK